MNREVVARASRPCVGRTNRTGETPVPLFRRNGSWPQCVRKKERGHSRNLRVLPASCRQRNLRRALPTRRRQHLVGGSWSQSMRINEWRLSMNRHCQIRITNDECQITKSANGPQRALRQSGFGFLLSFAIATPEVIHEPQCCWPRGLVARKKLWKSPLDTFAQR